MLTSRPLVPEGARLPVLIDTACFSRLLSKGDVSAKALLEYSGSKYFEFLRTPGDTEHGELRSVLAYSEKRDEKGMLGAIEIAGDESGSKTCFDYLAEDVERVGQQIYGKKCLDSSERETATLPFVLVALSLYGLRDSSRILITDREVLLKNRLRLEAGFPGQPQNIVSFEEAKEIMDLFLKYRSKYYIVHSFGCDKGLYYWLSFRSRVPHFHVCKPILNAFATRFVYLLTSVDEIGFQYYSRADNNAMDSMMYHFNYFVSLVSGVFDSLAIETRDVYSLGFEQHPNKVSLNPKVGRDFLKEVRKSNRELRHHITEYANFMKLIYELRELVVHRELLGRMAIGSCRDMGPWRMNLFRISRDIALLIRASGDRSSKGDQITPWGVYRLADTEYLLEPFRFVKSVARKLVAFADEYLRLIGFSDFLEDLHNPGHADHRFRWMPSTHFEACRPAVPAHGVQFFRGTGIGGRLGSESVDGMFRNPEEQD